MVVAVAINLHGCTLAERNIDVKTFVDLSREDIVLVFPGTEKFLLGMKLYKLVQTYHSDGDLIRKSYCMTLTTV